MVTVTNPYSAVFQFIQFLWDLQSYGTRLIKCVDKWKRTLASSKLVLTVFLGAAAEGLCYLGSARQGIIRDCEKSGNLEDAEKSYESWVDSNRANRWHHDFCKSGNRNKNVTRQWIDLLLQKNKQTRWICIAQYGSVRIKTTIGLEMWQFKFRQTTEKLAS